MNSSLNDKIAQKARKAFKKKDQVKAALLEERKRQRQKEDTAAQKLMVEEFFELKPLALPERTSIDHKKL